jgi:YesN/AraC family two-component response regulator
MYRLIIIEDEYEIRKGLTECFPWTELGFEVVRDFAGGAKAVEWLEDTEVDVVVTDVRMDDGSGLDVAEYLKNAGRLETVVFYSAYKDFDYARRGMSFGVKRYITKDMGYNELIEVFRQVKNDLDREISVAGRVLPVSPGETEQHGDPVVNQVLRYVAKSYRTATLQSAAKIVQFNPYYLSAYIKSKTGDNFRSILTRVRMEKARELLEDPTYRTAEISDLLGYSDVRNFVRCFKSYYGEAPGSFKKNRKS